MDFLSFFKKENKSTVDVEMQKNAQLINECNRKIDELYKRVQTECVELHKIMPTKVDSLLTRIFWNKIPNDYAIKSSSEVKHKIDVTNETHYSLEKFVEMFINDGNILLGKIKNNTKDFEKFINEKPKFFVVEDLSVNESGFYFSPIITSTIDENGVIGAKALVTSSTVKESYVENFFSDKDFVRKMTKEEFEKYFLPNRIEVLNLSLEKDIVEYVNFMRLTFKESQL